MMMNVNLNHSNSVINMTTRLDSLVLSNQRPLYEYYVLQSGGQYIAFDTQSGGWPYETSLSRAHKYSTLEAAIEASGIKHGSTIIHCKVYGEVVQQHDIDHGLRASAIAKLTPEEIRALGLG